MKNILYTLQELGLSPKEALIYRALLRHGKMSISKIARESTVKRATVYQYINALLKKDFIVRMPIGKRMFYRAANPKKILQSFEKKKKTLTAEIENMAQLFNKTTHKPKVSFYEGKREIRKIYDELFQLTGDMYSIFPPKSFFSNFSEKEYQEFDVLIKQHVFKSKDLMVQQEGLQKVLNIRKENGKQHQQTKILPEWFTSNIDIVICKHTVALISLSNLSALVIENADIAEFFTNMHTFFWKHS